MKEFMKKISIPENEREGIIAIYEKIKSDSTLYADLDKSADLYLEKGADFGIEGYMRDFSEKVGENIYAVHLVFLIECAMRVKKVYDQKGISEEIYYDTMTDLAYKSAECRKLCGVYGIRTFTWFHWLLGVYTFMLGRLEYAVIRLEVDSYKNYAKKGDIVYGVHIPSSGPLTYESVMDSLKKAYKFFGCEKHMVVQCESWMMGPSLYREVFPEGSNLRMFYELFDVTDELLVKDNSANLWRVFYRDADTPVSELPEDTRLQRNLKGYLSEGKLMHCGRGFLVFDGEKIINK